MSNLIQKIKWWWNKHDVVCVWDELDGKRANFYKKVPNKKWWEQAEYTKI